ADLPTASAQSQTLVKGGMGLGGALWGPIVEKAFAMFRIKPGTARNTYASLNGGGGFQAVFPPGLRDPPRKGPTSRSDANALPNDPNSKLAAGLAVAVGIQVKAPGAPLVEHHAYTVVSVKLVNGAPVSVVLRNPWAKDGGGNNDGADDGFVTITAQQLF